MGRVVGLLSVVIVLAIGMYVYMHQVQDTSPTGATPKTSVDVIGVKNDLNAIAQAERSYHAQNGKYVSIDELVESGEMTFKRDHRDNYSYSVDTSDSGFHVIATYNGPDPNAPRTITIDEAMNITQQ